MYVITLSGENDYIIKQQVYYIIRWCYYVIRHAVITLSGDYYIIGCTNTDEHADPDMFGASARAKPNAAPRFKTSPNFYESADIYNDQMFGF